MTALDSTTLLMGIGCTGRGCWGADRTSHTRSPVLPVPSHPSPSLPFHFSTVHPCTARPNTSNAQVLLLHTKVMFTRGPHPPSSTVSGAAAPPPSSTHPYNCQFSLHTFPFWQIATMRGTSPPSTSPPPQHPRRSALPAPHLPLRQLWQFHHRHHERQQCATAQEGYVVGTRRGSSRSAGPSAGEEGVGVQAHIGSGADVGGCVMAYVRSDAGHGIIWTR